MFTESHEDAFILHPISIYADTYCYASFDDFAERMIANMRFNGYSKESVLAHAVRQRFNETVAAGGINFVSASASIFSLSFRASISNAITSKESTIF